ncbi:hypothetical protein V8F20_004724 [Naviculisporaceae sp. PSN 640]
MSAAWSMWACLDKECFCSDPEGIDDLTMYCVTSAFGVKDPLGTYNAAMYFYATECGTFEFQKKASNSADIQAFEDPLTKGWESPQDYLTQGVTIRKTYPTTAPPPAPSPTSNPAPNPKPDSYAGVGVQAIPTAVTTQQNPAPTNTRPAESDGGSAEYRASSNPDLSVGGIIGIIAGVCTILALFVTIYMCWCK